jgi:phage shock protein PspC (stress-responsive transcriptional regulator)
MFASFAISLGPIFWLLIAEIYPLRIRGVAEGTAATFNWASNLIVSLTFLTLVEKLGASSTFLLYAFASVASWLFAYYFSGNQGAHSGTDRSLLESKAWCSPSRPELPRARCRCSHGPAGCLPGVKRSVEGTGRRPVATTL